MLIFDRWTSNRSLGCFDGLQFTWATVKTSRCLAATFTATSAGAFYSLGTQAKLFRWTFLHHEIQVLVIEADAGIVLITSLKGVLVGIGIFIIIATASWLIKCEHVILLTRFYIIDWNYAEWGLGVVLRHHTTVFHVVWRFLTSIRSALSIELLSFGGLNIGYHLETVITFISLAFCLAAVKLEQSSIFDAGWPLLRHSASLATATNNSHSFLLVVCHICIHKHLFFYISAIFVNDFLLGRGEERFLFAQWRLRIYVKLRSRL